MNKINTRQLRYFCTAMAIATLSVATLSAYAQGGSVAATTTSAQVAPSAPRSVSGTVKGPDGEGVIGATVVIDGTSSGTLTGVNGEYTLAIPASVTAPKLNVNYLGYDPQTVNVGNRTTVDITMTQQIQQVERVVITALGIKRAEKALSYNVQQVDADAVTANKDANFLNSLSGKVAGVNINASSSGVGGASRVVMRGQKSINASSNALYVIDGVPMMTSPATGDTEFGSKGSTDPMADINPEDIESISVLAGAAAAALYGSDAANGAIIVTTKRGSTERLSVSVSSSTEIMTPFVLPRFQNRYGTGDLNLISGSVSDSWGRKLSGAGLTGYDPAKDYFQLGVTASENVSLSTGSEKNQTYLSAGALNSKGIVPNNTYDRYNFTFRNTTKFFKDKMTLDVNASYILQEDQNVTNQGTYSNPIVGAYLFPRGDDWEDAKMYERYNTDRGIYEQYWKAGDYGMTVQNPYWVNYRNLRENRKDRYMLGAALSYDILDWLNVSGRMRMDNSHNKYERKYYASTLNTLMGIASSNGAYEVANSKDRQIYGDVLVNINKTFGKNWSLSANVGASFTDMKYDEMSVNGPISDGSSSFDPDGSGDMLPETAQIPNVFNVFNISNSKTARRQSGWREQTQSVFGSVEVGFKGTYYLTVTGRNDWPSALAGPNSTQSSFFYPSVGVSVLLSEIIPKVEQLSYLKVRASYASVGTPFARFLANPRFGWDSSSTGWSLALTNYPFYALKPERTQSFEVGLQARFLKNFNLDFTYYYARTQNQTFNPGISAGSGSSDIYVQSGDVLNTGVELSLGYRNTWGIFSWDTNYTFSSNKNKILALAEDAINPITGESLGIDMLDMGGLGRARFLLKKGGTLGDLYSSMDLMRDANGAIYKDVSGNLATTPITNVNDYIYLGSVLPKANMAWRNDFSVKGFNFGFMISARIGGVVYSQTQANLDFYGVSDATAGARDIEARGGNAILINGNIPVSAYNWYKTVGGSNPVPQYYTYSATNVRLQEASVGYTIPRKVLKDVCEITVSVVGRNLWMIYNKAPFDPESTAGTSNYYQGVDNFMMPSLRNIGFNLRLKF